VVVIDIHCMFLRLISRLTKLKFFSARLIAIEIFNRPAVLVGTFVRDILLIYVLTVVPLRIHRSTRRCLVRDELSRKLG